MVHLILTTVTDLLNEYLNGFYDVPEGIVELSMPDPSGEDTVNKLLLSLYNIERETSMGIANAYHPKQDGSFIQTTSPWYLNLYFIVAAVFDEKHYVESLKILSKAISFFQQTPSFRLSGGETFTIEPVTLNTQELTNVWSIMGGKYYPSIACKLRLLTVKEDEINRTVERITQTEVGY